MNKEQMIKRAQAWQAERERIMDTEGETGYLDASAIQGSDDDAVDFAGWIAAGMPETPVSCNFCGNEAHEPSNNCGGSMDGTTWCDPYLLTGSYGTFEIQRVVFARDEDHAFEMTGVMADLINAGWVVTEDPDGEEWTVTAIGPRPDGWKS